MIEYLPFKFHHRINFVDVIKSNCPLVDDSGVDASPIPKIEDDGEVS
jgi:hypothetical protein